MDFMLDFSADAISVGEVSAKRSQDLSRNPVLTNACVGEAVANVMSNASRAAEKRCNTNQFQYLIVSFINSRIQSGFPQTCSTSWVP